jgi:predicted nucleotidyltransferase component of viral defense system
MISERVLKERLQTIAKEKGIHFNACWKQLLLERFLARLSSSLHVDKFIFKGGFLLAYLMKIGRETVDLDFSLTRVKAEKKELTRVFEQIIAAPSSDGFSFSLNGIAKLAQPHMDYPGYRVVLKTAFAKRKDEIQIDIGIGDSVEPLNRTIKLIDYKGNALFESSISLLVYPVESIFAEKLEIILSKGAANTRMKDYHDLMLLIHGGMIDRGKLKTSIWKTFTGRGTLFRPVEFKPSGYQALQRLWTAHLHGLGDHNLGLPQDISSLIERLNQYLNEVGLHDAKRK